MKKPREATRAEYLESLEAAARWSEVRVRVMCPDADYGSFYLGGYKHRRLPSADEQARRMR